MDVEPLASGHERARASSRICALATREGSVRGPLPPPTPRLTQHAPTDGDGREHLTEDDATKAVRSFTMAANPRRRS